MNPETVNLAQPEGGASCSALAKIRHDGALETKAAANHAGARQEHLS
ncbi:hypothetical protein [Erythrobacter tepidarius]|nr:hypothetical protein [Erythrobacter tepidarius]